eukprot:GHVN01019831.1.p1 GENE.GHVN01019831.1~~GHVN01019831.1.p1  ORF type:complete len:1027 (-),score=232.80 GHVN01019831.1:3305-6385(-)
MSKRDEHSDRQQPYSSRNRISRFSTSASVKDKGKTHGQSSSASTTATSSPPLTPSISQCTSPLATFSEGSRGEEGGGRVSVTGSGGARRASDVSDIENKQAGEPSAGREGGRSLHGGELIDVLAQAGVLTKGETEETSERHCEKAHTLEPFTSPAASSPQLAPASPHSSIPSSPPLTPSTGHTPATSLNFIETQPTLNSTDKIISCESYKRATPSSLAGFHLCVEAKPTATPIKGSKRSLKVIEDPHQDGTTPLSVNSTESENGPSQREKQIGKSKVRDVSKVSDVNRVKEIELYREGRDMTTKRGNKNDEERRDEQRGEVEPSGRRTKTDELQGGSHQVGSRLTSGESTRETTENGASVEALRMVKETSGDASPADVGKKSVVKGTANEVMVEDTKEVGVGPRGGSGSKRGRESLDEANGDIECGESPSITRRKVSDELKAMETRTPSAGGERTPPSVLSTNEKGKNENGREKTLQLEQGGEEKRGEGLSKREKSSSLTISPIRTPPAIATSRSILNNHPELLTSPHLITLPNAVSSPSHSMAVSTQMLTSSPLMPPLDNSSEAVGGSVGQGNRHSIMRSVSHMADEPSSLITSTISQLSRSACGAYVDCSKSVRGGSVKLENNLQMPFDGPQQVNDDRGSSDSPRPDPTLSSSPPSHRHHIKLGDPSLGPPPKPLQSEFGASKVQHLFHPGVSTHLTTRYTTSPPSIPRSTTSHDRPGSTTSTTRQVPPRLQHSVRPLVDESELYPQKTRLGVANGTGGQSETRTLHVGVRSGQHGLPPLTPTNGQSGETRTSQAQSQTQLQSQTQAQSQSQVQSQTQVQSPLKPLGVEVGGIEAKKGIRCPTIGSAMRGSGVSPQSNNWVGWNPSSLRSRRCSPRNSSCSSITDVSQAFIADVSISRCYREEMEEMVKVLGDRLGKIEESIYDVETQYLLGSSDFGNIVNGWNPSQPSSSQRGGGRNNLPADLGGMSLLNEGRGRVEGVGDGEGTSVDEVMGLKATFGANIPLSDRKFSVTSSTSKVSEVDSK